MLARSLSQSVFLAAETGLSDIREIVPYPNYWPWLWTALAAIALAAAITFWIRRRQRRPATRPSAEPPHVKALRRLHALRDNGADLEAEPFTVEVSSILRVYLEEALDLPAPEQTSEEFLRDLRAQPWLTPQLQADLEEFARLTDLVKFAGQSLAVAEREGLLKSAENVVETSRPEPEPVSC